jgi:hypothetical protein
LPLAVAVELEPPPQALTSISADVAETAVNSAVLSLIGFSFLDNSPGGRSVFRLCERHVTSYVDMGCIYRLGLCHLSRLLPSLAQKAR